MVRVAENVRSTHNRDGGIILDILRGQMFRLNFVGSKILELLKLGCAESEIAEQLAADFGIDRTTVRADVEEFLAILAKHHLLVERNSDPLS